ncbi:MAG: TonB-dependent receptor [Candidatus Marinimicrobia bacterium]|nr:TonB-dependent receptor [Candidatus Neomarinimicrobiota bacterium]
MKIISLIAQCYLLMGILFSQGFDSLNLLDIGNEIQQLEKQYEKLPQLFNSKLLPIYEDKLDKRLSVNPTTHESRIKVENPSYHWCMSKLYLLSGNDAKLREHYVRYLELIKDNSDIPMLFQQPIPITKLVVSEVVTPSLDVVTENDTEESVTSESDSDEGIKKTISPTKKITREDVKESNQLVKLTDFSKVGIYSISDLMDHIAGVQSIHRGAAGSQSTLRVIGGGANHIVFLINGMRSFHSNVIFDSFNFPFDIDDVEYVEVDLSPSSHKYGFSATGIVVNFLLKNYDSFATHLNFQSGDYSHNKIHVDANLPIGESNHTISYSGISNGGYVYNSDISSSKLLYRYSLKDDNSTANLTFGTHSDEHGVLLLSSDSVYPTEKYNSLFFDSRLSWKFGSMDLNSHTHWNENEYSYLVGNSTHNFTITDLGYDFEGERTSANNLYNFGFSAARETILDLSESEQQRDRVNLFYNCLSNRGDLTYSDGLSANYFEGFGWNYSFGFKLDYQLYSDVGVHYQYDSGYKLPSAFEQFSDFSAWKGNSALESEKVKTTQIGLEVENDILNVDVSLFYKSTQNAIDWQYLLADENWIGVNIPEVKVNGHQISADVNIESFPLIGFISQVELDYTFIDLSHEAGEYRYTSNYLTHQFRSSFDYNLFFGLSQSWFIRYEDPAQFASRWLTDTVINLPIWLLNTSFSIENILDVNYQDELGFDASGRWMKFGLQFQY